ncbi:MAG: branched-chain amino acid ABC transporter permease [Candidatus Bipolaricaulis sp.]|jgi:branched-chain amino acid transport system permease protein|uniref:Branched-chain amino acid ABC-type transport system, permease component n=1 Tax=Candidatus Bipolaricaulis anaerobius TaxID=2026885 RepID=A0A2X3K798_9BACT|nr:branched-chain amino acid ABC transporter permease [Candidatus Bipolaricaulis anaerobius]MBP7726036.1 branched-chain amino acid ABC transporter permease [Candidatus Bipolaricaulis sp.]SQD93107.1 Branched-chain amino acid ABC-type transport system, permease component [Candidatus Bipolaricaulis anaerobius]
MTLVHRLERKQCLIGLITLVVLGVVAAWKPYALIEGLQRGGLYSLIALPMALILGIVGIINLAHGEFMMLGAYFAYWLWAYAGLDPLVAMVPSLGAFALIGAVTYSATIRRVLKAPELTQLLLTFGLALMAVEFANLMWTSRPWKPHLSYIYSSVSIGSLTFGIYPFVYTVGAIVVLIGLMAFLRRTRIGKAALAVGQNPRGAELVGINVNRTYLLIFTLSIALVGAIGGLFLTRHSVFPAVGSPFTLKSFCLIAMAGVGNLPGVLWGGFALGIAEALVLSFREAYMWADVVFFAVLVGVILGRSYRRHTT